MLALQVSRQLAAQRKKKLAHGQQNRQQQTLFQRWKPLDIHLPIVRKFSPRLQSGKRGTLTTGELTMGIAVIGRIGAALVHVAPGDTRRADHYHAIGDAIATWVRHRHVKAKVTRGINRGGYAALGDAIVIAATPQRCMVRNHLDGIVDACRAALGYTREAREREAREREARKADTVRELRRVVTQHKRQAPLKHNPFAVLRGTFDLS